MELEHTEPSPSPSARPAQSASLNDDLETVRAYLDQARHLAGWHRGVAEAFESKAAIQLGFAGVIGTQLPDLLKPIGQLSGRWESAALLVLGGSAASLLAAAICALQVIRPRPYEYASRSQLRDEWQRHKNEPPYTTAQVTGMLADQLIVGTGSKSPIDTIVDDAAARSSMVKWSQRALLSALSLLILLAAILAAEVGVK